MFIKCEDERGGFVWINVSQIKTITESYYGNNELAGYWVKTVDNLEYRCADDTKVEEFLNGRG